MRNYNNYNSIPVWFIVLFAAFLVAGVASFVYSVQECGFATTMMLGDRAVFAAASGMCEKLNNL